MFPRILFDRTKYGVPLLVDACPIAAIPGFTVEGSSHRLGFYEVALITRGKGTLRVDDAAIGVAPRRVVVTGPGEVRRWHLDDRGFAGFVVFFEGGFVNEFFRDGRFVERMPLMASAPASRSPLASRHPFDELVRMAETMCGEVRNLREDSEHALRAQTYRLLVTLQRMATPALPANAARPRSLGARFEEAVEARFATEDRVEDYAAALGVSGRYLSARVSQSLGVTPSEAIRRRRHLEACRLLLHTSRSVAAISDALGFSGPSWFIRSFKRQSGMTPGEFRLGRESDIPVPASDLRRKEIGRHD
jgi:AraC-like DNA-binding protein